MGKPLQIEHNHDELGIEEYPLAIRDKINKVEDKFSDVVYNRLQMLEARTLDYIETVINPQKTISEDIKELLSKIGFTFDLSALIPAILVGAGYARDEIVRILQANGVKASDLEAKFNVDLKFKPDEVMFTDLVGKRAQYLAKVLQKTTLRKVNKIIRKGIKEGWSIIKIRQELEATGVFDRNRADLIARTEVAYALNAGTLEYLHSQGIEKFKIDTADNACPVCKGLAEWEYTFKEAKGLLPVHPRCRCVWVAVIPDEWLKPIET
jgi:SPP1 gp7 family putative phage head morphogenesis protein